ncbi:inner nuclear membrane protein enriched at telomere/subtelomere region [Linnemannia zychae]|nr:inner nuclear membrane protein enriched at telomere/subtelomere region [Linnemannia zychae]
MSVPRYLQAGFNPMTIKMDSIREILIHHKVKPPTGEVRKQDLVDLFELHIRPRAAELRKPYERDILQQEPTTKAPTQRSQPHERPQTLSQYTQHQQPAISKPSSSSITHDVQPTRQEKATALSSSTSSMSSSTSTKRREPKNSTVAKPIYTDEGSEAKPRPRRKIVVDEGTDMDSSSTSSSIRGRKLQKSTFKKGEESEFSLERRSPRKKKLQGSRKQKDTAGENFSDENPFQSGSESERRRRSKNRDFLASVGSSRTSSTIRKSRRRSGDDEARLDQDHVFKVPAQPAFSKYMITPKYTAGSPAFDRTEFDSGPFHNSPLSAKTKRMSISTLPPPSPRIIQFESATNTYGTRSKRVSDNPNLGPFKFILFMVLLSYGLWYRQTRIDMGFCTPSTFNPTPTSNEPLTVKQWLVKWIYPTCIACPNHATCDSSNSDPLCPPEYILRPHPLSFGNLIPLTPSCVLNKAQEYQSLQVADAAENMLHKLAGQEECRSSTRPQPSAELLARQRLSIHELRKEIESLKDASVSQEEFDQYWSLALSELYRRSSTLIIEQGIGERYLRSVKPARPFFCRVRQGVLGWIEQFKEIILALMTLGIGGALTRNYILKRREEARIVHGLVDEVLSKLSEQADAHDIDPFHFSHPFVPQIHLRDVLLAHIHSPVQRQDIWEKVSVIVDRNANVRVSAEEVHGEIYRVWQWIGASGVLSQKSLGASGRLGSSTGSNNGSSVGGGYTAFGGINNRILHETEQDLHASTGGSLYPSLS